MPFRGAVRARGRGQSYGGAHKVTSDRKDAQMPADITPSASASHPEKTAANIVSIEVAQIRRLVAGLPKRHRLIITWRYGLDGLTLNRHEMAERLRVDPRVICRTEREALRLLRGRALNVNEGRAAA